MHKKDPLYLTYVSMVNSMSQEMKLTLLSILTESLQADKTDTEQHQQIEEQPEEKSWLHLNGSWEGPETAEEIISSIKDKPITELF